jgi:hypothetical protein
VTVVLNTDIGALQARTRLRNSTLWTPFDWGEVMQPMTRVEAYINRIYQPFIEGYMAETDELFAIKEYQQEKLSELETAKITQDGRIAEADAAAKRLATAIRLAAEEYIQAARLFDASVKAQIMAAKEYAAEVEREQIEIEKLRAQLGVAKAEARLKEINAEVYYEYVRRMEVEVDKLRAQVQVAQANVRALLADINAREAELTVIESELKEAMTIAEKATLQADVASIYAEIIVKGLSKIKLAVESAEITAGFRYITSKLNDLLAIWNVKTREEQFKVNTEAQVASEVLALLSSEKAGEDLKKDEMSSNEGVLAYEQSATAAELSKEQGLTDQRVAARKALDELKNDYEMTLSDLNAWAKKIANAAQRWVNKNHVTIEHRSQDMSQLISKG